MGQTFSLQDKVVTHSSRNYPSGYEDLLSDAMHSGSIWPRSLSPVDGFSGSVGSGPVALLSYRKGDGIRGKTYVVRRLRNRRKRMCGKGDGARGSVT